MGQILGRAFYARDAEVVARELIGKVLVRTLPGGELRRARLLETEAYVGVHDLACHASKGRTARTEVMFGPAGVAYIYLIYGMYDMLNIVTGNVGEAQAVLIRGAQPLGWKGDLSGPGKLARALAITRALNQTPVTGGELFVEDDGVKLPYETTKRIGVAYAGEWAEKMLRFVAQGGKC